MDRVNYLHGTGVPTHSDHGSNNTYLHNGVKKFMYKYTVCHLLMEAHFDNHVCNNKLME